jgi:hypothetical protein
MGVIDMGNASIDSPSRAQRYSYRQMLGTNELPKQVEGLLGVDRRGHRQYNHDIVSGFLAVSQVAPKYVPEILIGHALMDLLSDQMRDSMGSHNRDLFQALLNHQHVEGKKRKTKIKF